MLKRNLEHAIKRAMDTFPAVLVSGPRQSGKTTLLKTRWSNTHRYVSLENPDIRDRVLKDPKGFLKQFSPPLILDEIQYAPELLSYIKTSIDENRKPGQWLLSGSQQFPLMQGISQSLAGRVAILNLLPFSLDEASESTKADLTINDLLDSPPEINTSILLSDWILRGAYPEPRANPDVDRQLWCGSYIQSYLERDVRQILNVGDLNAFERFLRLCAARTAQILNLSNLADDTGISVPTAKRWLSVLEASWQVYLLPPYFANFRKRIIKSPKMYFIDTGLASFLTGFHQEEPLRNGPLWGALFETAIIASWLKIYLHRGEMPALYYWRSRGGPEVDLIVERNGKIYPFEVKSTSTVTSKSSASLKKWLEISGRKEGRIIADIGEIMPVVPGVTALPWKRF